MCGLCGILIEPNPEFKSWDPVRELFTEALLANEERGREATGIAVLEDTGNFFVHKAAVPANEFIRLREYKTVMDQLGPGVTLVLGHTRRPTKGSVQCSHNNHPLVVGDVVGIHNGTITNDDAIFLNFDRRRDPRRKRIGSVDSEAIFTLMDDALSGVTPDPKTLGIQRAAQLLLGSYTTLFFHRRYPFQVFVLKYNEPLSIHYAPEYRALVFSSRYVFLRKKFGRSVVDEILPARSGYIFDARTLALGLGKETVRFDLHSEEKRMPAQNGKAAADCHIPQ